MADRNERTHYSALGVGPGAGVEEIRRAHRQLARVLHPDRQSDATDAERRLAERRMREVNAAWTVLSDPSRRRDYDRSLQSARVTRNAAQAARPASSTPGSGATSRSTGRPEDATDPDEAYLRARLDELDDDEPELSAAQFWLLRRVPVLLALVVAAALLVLTAYAGGGSGGDDSSVTTAAGAQGCVRRTEGRTAVRVDCDRQNDGRIVTSVDRALDCPPATSYVVLDGTFTCVTTDPTLRSNVTPDGGG